MLHSTSEVRAPLRLGRGRAPEQDRAESSRKTDQKADNTPACTGHRSLDDHLLGAGSRLHGRLVPARLVMVRLHGLRSGGNRDVQRGLAFTSVVERDHLVLAGSDVRRNF